MQRIEVQSPNELQIEVERLRKNRHLVKSVFRQDVTIMPGNTSTGVLHLEITTKRTLLARREVFELAYRGSHGWAFRKMYDKMNRLNQLIAQGQFRKKVNLILLVAMIALILSIASPGWTMSADIRAENLFRHQMSLVDQQRDDLQL